MKLADLKLSDLPDEVLKSLIAGMKGELKRREIEKEHQRTMASMQRRELAKEGLRKQSLSFGAYTIEVNHIQPYHEALLRFQLETPEMPRAIPDCIRKRPAQDRLHYLPHLLRQDWSGLFIGTRSGVANYYVYTHLNPQKEKYGVPSLDICMRGRPFYIGKGIGKRAWDLKRNEGHGRRLSALLKARWERSDLVQILQEGCVEQEALILEAKLIYFFGSMYELNTMGCLFNLADHMRPAFREELPLLPNMKDYYEVTKQAFGAYDLKKKAQAVENSQGFQRGVSISV